MSAFRIGHGYDVHRLVPGRKLILGGVEVPFDRGLLGHSDADVLTHAVMDALLGAAGLGDIGKLFPDSDPAYAGISSLLLLDRVAQRLREAGWQVGNVDATVLAQQPKLAPHIPKMRPGIWASFRSRSTSRPPRRRAWASPAPGRAWPPMQSVCWSRQSPCKKG